MESSARQELSEYIDSLRIIDTHEHLRNRHDFQHGLVDFIFTASFIKEDLFSSGLDTYEFRRGEDSRYRPFLNSEKYLALAGSPDELIARIGPYLRSISNTSYYRFTMRAFRDLYQLPEVELDRDGWNELSAAIRRAYSNEDSWRDSVIREKCHIDMMIRDLGEEEVDRPYIVPVARFDYLLFYRYRSVLSRHIHTMPWDDFEGMFRTLDTKYGSIATLDEYLEMVDREMSDRIARLHIVGIKIGLAYNRPLYFENVPENEARRIFAIPPDATDVKDAKRFGDFIMHRIIRRASDEHLVIQIHTGMQGVVSDLSYANPLQLNHLLLLYPAAKFDLFHGGYPFSNELLTLVKVAPNAYFNICWLPLISQEAAREVLNKALDMIPSNKILWGGDCSTVEEIYGATRVIRELLSEVLVRRVEEGKLNVEEARFVAENILSAGARDLYKLSPPP
jgi:predicted TIM-barrel fold metal-dependent hydrolase